MEKNPQETEELILQFDTARIFLAEEEEEEEEASLIVSLKDITERKLAEDALRESEARYRVVFERAGDYVLMLDTELEGIPLIMDANEAALSFHGYSRDEIIGKPITMLEPEMTAETLLERKQLVETEGGGIISVHHHRKDGSGFDAEAYIQPVQIGSKSVLLSIERDITKRRIAEEALRESEARLRDIIFSSSDFVWEVNVQGYYTYCSEKTEDILGYTPEEMLSKTQFDFMPPEEAVRISKIFQEILAKKERIIDLENWNLHKDGHPVCLLTNGIPLIDKRGNLTGYRGVDKDITERRRGEEALRESQEKLAGIIQAIPDYLSIIDEDYIMVWANDVLKNTYGQDTVGKKCHQIYHHLDKPCDRCLIKEVFADGKSHQHEAESVNTVGEKIYQLSTANVASRYPNGKPKTVIELSHDITKRKLAEDALRESEEKFRNIVEGTGAIIFSVNRRGRFTYVNEAAIKTLGYSREEIKGQFYLKFVYPEDKRRIHTIFQKQLEEGIDADNVELRFVNKEGSVGWFSLLVNLIKKKGEIIGLRGVAQDITEHKRAEEALQSAMQYWQNTFDAISDMVCVISIDHTFLAINKAGVDNLGLPEEQIIGRKCFELAHGTNSPIKICPCDECFRSGLPAENEYQSDGLYYSLLAWPIENESGKITAFVHIIKDITDRKRAEEALHESEAKFRSLIEQSNDAIYLLYEGRFEMINRKFTEMLGYTLDEIKRENFDISDTVAPKSRGLIAERAEKLKLGEKLERKYEFTALAKDGSEIEVEASDAYIDYKGGKAVQGILRDVSERKKLEAQFHQAQKMESIGRLAGGIAHDFNNLLTVIGGNTSLAMMQLMKDDPIYADLEQVKSASEKAGKLTKQLLSFSRKQQLLPNVININDIITGLSKMLTRLISEDIQLEIHLSEDLWRVKVDEGYFEQIIVNMCVNARDAMNEGGILTIETANEVITEEYAAKKADVVAGNYVRLIISDTGCGMDKETVMQIFDPFFTTKPEGEGTGLGLSTVYGIIKQVGGFVNVYSEPGLGTSFKIYIPETKDIFVEGKKGVISEDKLYGKETVMIVEDEDGVRNIAVRILERYGYNVIEAENGGIGYLKCKKTTIPIDLIVTDVIMPEMNGKEFIDNVREFLPDVNVLFMSGYTYNAIASRGIVESEVNFITKPFEPMVFVRKVREVLDIRKMTE